jgi:hypothetical protein
LTQNFKKKELPLLPQKMLNLSVLKMFKQIAWTVLVKEGLAENNYTQITQ